MSSVKVNGTTAAPSPETFKPLLKLLAVSPEKFTPADLENAIEHISHPQGTTDAQLGSWLTCIHFLGRERDPEFLAQYARLTRAKAVTVDLPNRTGAVVCDIVGTGGDGQDTFNASTAAAIVASGVPGMRVCKHGSKASTSKSGSADFLVELGIPITDLPAGHLPHSSPFLFLFAFLYHPTFAKTSPVRKQLPFPTIYNLLGPLINPGRPDVMVLGVYSRDLGPVFAHALKQNGVQGWVVCGAEGLDEISPAGQTYVWEVSSKGIAEKVITPEDFGLRSHSLESVRSGTAEENASTFRQLLEGEIQQDSALETFVMLNAAALLFVSGKAKDLVDGVRLARGSITSGAAKNVCEEFGQAVRERVDASKS